MNACAYPGCPRFGVFSTLATHDAQGRQLRAPERVYVCARHNTSTQKGPESGDSGYAADEASSRAPAEEPQVHGEDIVSDAGRSAAVNPTAEPEIEALRPTAGKRGRGKKAQQALAPFQCLLGEMTDTEISEKSGVSAKTVHRLRRTLGIEAVPRGQWSPASRVGALHDQVGKVPDGVIAELVGVHASTVGWYRRSHSIPPFLGNRAVIQDAAIALRGAREARLCELGITWAEVSRRVGAGPGPLWQVHHARMFTPRLRRAIAAELGLSYEECWGVPDPNVDYVKDTWSTRRARKGGRAA